MTASPIPAGYHCITPYLIIAGAARAIEFYRQAFGAEEMLRLADPSGKIGHAELKIGDSMIMLADEHLEIGARGPTSFGGSPVHILLYVADVDQVYAQAVAAGATAVRPVVDQFYGDRSGSVADPFGHSWTIATHIEDLEPEEISRRFQAMLDRAAPS